MNQPPLNPDALTSNPELFMVASTHHFHSDECLCGFKSARSRDRTEHIMLHTLAAAQPVAQKITDAEWQAFQAIPDQGYSHRSWVDARIAERVAVAQPEVNGVVDVPATMTCIAWEKEPEHGLWKISEDETFVGLIVKAGRSWSPADKYTLRIERPEVNDA